MRRRLNKKRTFRSAMALVAALWVSVLMMALVSVAAQSSLLDSRISQIENEKQRSRWACRAGIETAIGLLLVDDRTYDSWVDLWSYNPQELENMDFGGVTVTVEVVDAASKLNVNSATLQQLLSLPDMTEDIAEGILDWIDRDDTIRTGGAERGYYQTLDYPYLPRNGSTQTIRELQRVRGITEGLFSGISELETLSVENEGWINYLTCVSQEANLDSEGNERININRADTQSLTQDLGLSEGQALWVTQNRSFRRLTDMIGQATDTSQGAAQTSQQTPQAAQGGQAQQQQPGGQQQSGGQQQQVEPVPLDAATVLGMADKITLTNRRSVAGKININTAGLVVLTALFDGNRELAEKVYSTREGLGGAFIDLSDILMVDGMTQDVLRTYLDRIAIRSSIFEIRATAVSTVTGLTYRVEAIVNREASQGQVLYWREGIDR